MLVEAAKIPVSPEIEEVLQKRGVLVVPDIIANAGGVISSYAEYTGYNPKQMLKLVQRKIAGILELCWNTLKRKMWL